MPRLSCALVFSLSGVLQKSLARKHIFARNFQKICSAATRSDIICFSVRFLQTELRHALLQLLREICERVARGCNLLGGRRLLLGDGGDVRRLLLYGV